LFSLFVATICHAPRILAFEPNPTVYEILSANLAAYVPDGRALPCGLAAKPGEATFTFFTGYSLLSGFHADAELEANVVKSYIANQAIDADTASLAQQADAVIAPRFEAKQFAVELRTLSEVMRTENIAHVDLLKINVEKAEVEVLAGLGPDDWKRIDQVVAEIDLDANVAAIETMLRDNDFDYVIDQDPLLANTALRYVYAIRRGSGLVLLRDQSPTAHRKPIAMLPPPFLTEQRLFAYCRERLPEYMVPSAFVLLEQLPLTPNGKLDRQALPAPAIQRQTLEGGQTLERLAAIWSDLLATGDVASDDSFFDIGGTSLLAIRLGSRIENAFGVGFPLARVLEHHTLGQMAEAIDLLRAR
jgi:FkbM family methyltransferase